MTEKYSHYQEYFKSFLGGWSFEQGDRTLTIADIREEQMYDANTGGKKSGLCVYFNEEKLPMVLNSTNSDMIAKVVGSDLLQDWIGKRIILGQSKIRAFGKDQLVIRVRDKKPVEKKTEHLSADQLTTLKSLIESGAIKNEAGMLDFCGVNSLEELSKDQAEELIRRKSNG